MNGNIFDFDQLYRSLKRARTNAEKARIYKDIVEEAQSL
jgi:hypothetical protein